jgi:hypothetical protein
MEGGFNDRIPGNSSTTTFANGTAVPVTHEALSLYTPDEKRILHIIAITFASLSVLAGTLMFYWYIRLQKRTFRHTYISFVASC